MVSHVFLCLHAGAAQLSLLMLSIVCVCVIVCFPCCLIFCLEDDFEEVSGTVDPFISILSLLFDTQFDDLYCVTMQ